MIHDDDERASKVWIEAMKAISGWLPLNRRRPGSEKEI
jgi:hypothetical protein